MGVSPKEQARLDSGLRIKYLEVRRPNEDSLTDEEGYWYDMRMDRWRVVQRLGDDTARVTDPPAVGGAGEAGGDLPADDAGDAD